MKIEFDKYPEKILSRFKGGEGDFHVHNYFDGRVHINDVRIEPGTFNGMHEHTGDYEIIYVIEGNVLIRNGDGTEEHLVPGDVTYCPEGSSHSVIAEGNKPVRLLGIVPLSRP